MEKDKNDEIYVEDLKPEEVELYNGMIYNEKNAYLASKVDPYRDLYGTHDGILYDPAGESVIEDIEKGRTVRGRR